MRFIRDGEKGERIWWGVGGGSKYLSLHCHHQNDSCIKMGSNESHFNVSLIVKRKVTRQCPQTSTFYPQPKTHSLSASSMQDPSAFPGGGPTYPPSFRTTTSTSCCWRRPGCALPVTRPRSPTWLRLGTRSSPSPALQGGPAQKAGASPSS